ncbi:MAG: hypothetical protein ABI193_17135 [Minicystis sp.]
MPHRAPPPDFRHVGLLPGPGPATLALAVGLVGLGAFGLSFWAGAHALTALACALGGGTLAGITLGRDAISPGARQTAMTIVPWGILLEPEGNVRMLHWSAICDIKVYATHTRKGGTPAVVATSVEVVTEHEIWIGQRPGAAGLETLTVNLRSYAEEAGRPVALDLEGHEACGDGATEPVIDALIHAAEALCSTAQGARRLLLPPGGYRQISNGGVGPETIAFLREILTGGGGGEGGADPRPLAALVGVTLGARALLPSLVRLTTSPHPVVAAVARAAMIRLGGLRHQAGSIDELACFLFEEDSAQIARWAEEKSVS